MDSEARAACTCLTRRMSCVDPDAGKVVSDIPDTRVLTTSLWRLCCIAGSLPSGSLINFQKRLLNYDVCGF